MSTLLATHASTLTLYRAQIATLESQLVSVRDRLGESELALADARTDEAFWKRRVQELDRANRVQALELASAKRGKREAEQELARVRVALEAHRVRVQDREVQTEREEPVLARRWAAIAKAERHDVARRDDRDDYTVRQSRDVRERPDVHDRGFTDDVTVRESNNPVSHDNTRTTDSTDRERRRNLREKLRATRERVGGMRERAGAPQAEEDAAWRGWAAAESTYTSTLGSRARSRVI